MNTTLNKIKEHKPCEGGWEKLLKFLNKTDVDDEELSLLTILESNGLDHAVWALRAVDGFDREKRLMACDFAEDVVHLANDHRCVNPIKVARDFANELATKEEMAAAADADAATYSDAAAAAATYSDASAAAAAAADAATAAAAATAATAAAAAAATAAAAAMKEIQVIIFKKYMRITKNQ